MFARDFAGIRILIRAELQNATCSGLQDPDFLMLCQVESSLL